MRERRYVVVIMDSSGRSLRRLGISRSRISTALFAAAALTVIALGMAIHAGTRIDDAAQARELAAENQALQELLADVEPRLPAARTRGNRAEMHFAQVFSKSGLGSEPRMLGIGPVEEDGGFGELVGFSGQIMSTDPIALPVELDRITTDHGDLQRALGELLEYFHDAERLLSNTPSIRPAPSPWITSSFGKRRDPITRQWLMHKGLDLGGFTGMQIVAPADGVVIWTGRRGGYGQVVVIDHGYGLQTHFAHLSRYHVHEGQTVTRGQVVAAMGSTGKSTGPHLHYEVRRHGQPQDPRPFILD